MAFKAFLSVLFCIVQASNNTFIPKTTGGPSPSAFYTTSTYIPGAPSFSPTNYPTLEPTWFPTVTGEFPYIRDAQSYIKCGRNIQLEDTQTNDAFAQFTIEQQSILSLSFVVCKATQPIHQLDTLRIWHFDEDENIWNYDATQPIKSNIDCSLILKRNLNSDIQTFYISLRKYLPNDYGKYTLYMHCDGEYNSVIAPAPLSPPIYGRINDYIQPVFDESDIHIIGSISCDIIWTQEITQSAFFQKEQYYKFVVNEYLEWIGFTTCNDTNKAHSLTLYYTNGGTTWSSMTKISDSDSMCAMLDRLYLIPGVYWLSVDISNLLYSHYTLAMFCSDPNAITPVTEYDAYVPIPPPAINPTQFPNNEILTTEMKESVKKYNSAVNAVGIAVSLIIISLFLLGMVFGYRKYKKGKNKKDMLKDVKVEMIANSSACYNENKNKNDDSSDDSSDYSVKASVEKNSEDQLIGSNDNHQEGDIEGAGVMENENESQSGDGGKEDEEIAAPAFANMNFEIEPAPAHIPGHIEMNIEIAPIVPIDEDNTIAMEDNGEEKIEVVELPKEQKEFMIGSYCYVDCDTVYGVIVDELKYEYFLILDFWEKRKRKAPKKSLSLIQNPAHLEKAKKRHQKYRKSKRKKSSSAR